MKKFLVGKLNILMNRKENKMKFTVLKKELADALKILMKAVAVKSQTPILSGIYFSAQKNYIEMHATDNNIGIISKIPANIEADGEVIIIGKKLFEIVLKFSGEVVTIFSENNFAELSSAGTKYSLLTFSPETFPKIKQETTSQKITLHQYSLKRLIKQTVFAADNSKEPTRPIFAGVLFNFTNEKITLAATNTHRLAVAITELSEPVENLKFIVPAKILQDIFSILSDGKVEICYTEKAVNFIFDNFFITARLISGIFPPIEKLLNEDRNIFAKVVREDFLNALERVAVIGKETDYQTVNLSFDDGIKISANSDEIGKAEENISAEILGENIDISFNCNYLIEALKVIDAEKIQIGLTESLKPIEIKSVDDDSFKYVVTPVRRS